jgi:hypothetical protein
LAAWRLGGFLDLLWVGFRRWYVLQPVSSRVALSRLSVRLQTSVQISKVQTTTAPLHTPKIPPQSTSLWVVASRLCTTAADAQGWPILILGYLYGCRFAPSGLFSACHEYQFSTIQPALTVMIADFSVAYINAFAMGDSLLFYAKLSCGQKRI